jgi:hypothetical protein
LRQILCRAMAGPSADVRVDRHLRRHRSSSLVRPGRTPRAATIAGSACIVRIVLDGANARVRAAERARRNDERPGRVRPGRSGARRRADQQGCERSVSWTLSPAL